MSILHRERPISATTRQPRCEESSRFETRQVRERSTRIRDAWSQEERAKRAYTARMVQWLLLGPPVGFRLEAE